MDFPFLVWAFRLFGGYSPLYTGTMLIRMTGILEALDDSDPRTSVAHLEREGLVYAVDVPGYVARELADKIAQPVTLHTLQYLEGSPAGGNLTPRLIGFVHRQDRAFLEKFTTVKGIGVRKALRALDQPPSVVAGWIEQGDAKALQHLPEIGKRLAETIIAELRGKLGAWLVAPADGAGTTALPTVSAGTLSDQQREAIQILIAWGDRPLDAERAVHALLESEPALAEAHAAQIVRTIYRHRAR